MKPKTKEDGDRVKPKTRRERAIARYREEFTKDLDRRTDRSLLCMMVLITVSAVINGLLGPMAVLLAACIVLFVYIGYMLNI